MNLALYGLGSDGSGDWLCVDMGVAFAGEDLPGINLMVPDMRVRITDIQV
jgi:ribonuclease J